MRSAGHNSVAAKRPYIQVDTNSEFARYQALEIFGESKRESLFKGEKDAVLVGDEGSADLKPPVTKSET